MGWTKFTRRKLSLPIITAIIFTFLAFIFLLYTERITTISRFKLNCPKDDRALESDSIGNPADDNIDFDPDECSVNHGKWIFNSSIKPLYTDRTCPYIDKQYSCIKNGRNDSYYLHWEWKLAANHLLLVVFPGQGHKRRFNNPTLEPQDEMQSRFFLDIIINQNMSIFKLFTGKDQSLLVQWNTFLVLNLGLDIVDGIAGFNFKSYGLPC